MNAIAIIKLAPGEPFFYDKKSGISLNINKKSSYVYKCDDLSGLHKALLNKQIMLESGTIYLPKKIVKESLVDLIKPVEPPVLSGVENISIFVNKVFNIMEGVNAMSNNKDITENVRTEGLVDINTPGEYTLIYTVSDAVGNTTTAERIVTVIDNAPPVLLGIEDVQIEMGTEFDPMAGVTATDNGNVDLTSQIKVTKKDKKIK